MRYALVTAALLLSACGTMDEQPANSAPAGAAQLQLPGEYRVAGVDGAEIDLPHGITASISEDTIAVQSDCIRFAFGYTLDGSRIVTEPTPVASCRRALLPDEQAISAAFNAAETVTRNSANGIEFSGGGRSVTLFPQ